MVILPSALKRYLHPSPYSRKAVNTIVMINLSTIKEIFTSNHRSKTPSSTPRSPLSPKVKSKRYWRIRNPKKIKKIHSLSSLQP